MKENQEQYKNIILLEKERNDLIQENENINNSLLEMDSRIKSKIPKTMDFKKRLKNIGQTSSNMVGHSVDNSNNSNNNNSKMDNINNNKIEISKKTTTNVYNSTNINNINNINTNINSSEKKKKASQTMTGFRKKK